MTIALVGMLDEMSGVCLFLWFCTGYSKRVSPDTASSIGTKGFLMKPVDFQALASMVRKVLDQAA